MTEKELLVYIKNEKYYCSLCQDLQKRVIERGLIAIDEYAGFICGAVEYMQDMRLEILKEEQGGRERMKKPEELIQILEDHKQCISVRDEDLLDAIDYAIGCIGKIEKIVNEDKLHDIVLDFNKIENLSRGERFIVQWQYRMLGDFKTALIGAIMVADRFNMQNLAMGFPDEVDAYIKYTEIDGWWEKRVLKKLERDEDKQCNMK